MPRLEDKNPLDPGSRRRIRREGMWLMVLVIATTLAGPAAVAIWYWSMYSENEIRAMSGEKD